MGRFAPRNHTTLNLEKANFSVNSKRHIKPWMLVANRRFLADSNLTPSDFRVLDLLLLDADANGEAWKAQSKIATEAATSQRQVGLSIKRLAKLDILQIRKVMPGCPLPSGIIASRKQSVYRFTERVTGENFSGEKISGEKIAPVNFAPTPVHSEAFSGENIAGSLHDRKSEKTKRKNKNHSTKKWASLGQQFIEMIHTLRENEPLDPCKLWKLVNEALEDGIAIPSTIRDTVSILEEHGLLEKSKNDKIVSVGWASPTPLSSLLRNANQSDDDDFS